jgi:DNA invertase Pin-like site-specific DNA recombinase
VSKFHAIYLRVSTRRQDTASQEPELRRWAESHEGEARWYHDTFTGTTMDRPGFRRLMADIEMGRVETLVVWRLDRLGRTARGLTCLFEDLVRCKVNLISLKDGLDLVTPAGRLMANILAGVAVPRVLFAAILGRIGRLRAAPSPG